MPSNHPFQKSVVLDPETAQAIADLRFTRRATTEASVLREIIAAGIVALRGGDNGVTWGRPTADVALEMAAEIHRLGVEAFQARERN